MIAAGSASLSRLCDPSARNIPAPLALPFLDAASVGAGSLAAEPQERKACHAQVHHTRCLACSRVAGGIALAIATGSLTRCLRRRADDLKKAGHRASQRTAKTCLRRLAPRNRVPKLPSAKDADVLTNGALTAAGSPADVDTVPAKFSARTQQMTNSHRRLPAQTSHPPTSATKSSRRSVRSATRRPAQPRQPPMRTRSSVPRSPSTIALQGLTAMPRCSDGKVPWIEGHGLYAVPGRKCGGCRSRQQPRGRVALSGQRLTVISASGRTQFHARTRPESIGRMITMRTFLVACLAAIPYRRRCRRCTQQLRAGYISGRIFHHGCPHLSLCGSVTDRDILRHG